MIFASSMLFFNQKFNQDIETGNFVNCNGTKYEIKTEFITQNIVDVFKSHLTENSPNVILYDFLTICP